MYLLFVVLVALGPMLRASRLAARAETPKASTPQPFGLAQLPG
jgi:BCD family chlorophyll transporter-like MFS transporter